MSWLIRKQKLFNTPPSLPDELWLKIVMHNLSCFEVVCLSCVNHQLHNTCMKPEIWKHLLLIDFAFYVPTDNPPLPTASFLDPGRVQLFRAVFRSIHTVNVTYHIDALRQLEAENRQFKSNEEILFAATDIARNRHWNELVPSLPSIAYEEIPSSVVQEARFYGFYKEIFIQTSQSPKFAWAKKLIHMFKPGPSYDDILEEHQKKHGMFSPYLYPFAFLFKEGFDPDPPSFRLHYRIFHILKTNQLIAGTPRATKKDKSRVNKIALLVSRLFGAMRPLGDCWFYIGMLTILAAFYIFRRLLGHR